MSDYSSNYSDEEVIQLSEGEEDYTYSESDSGIPKTPDIKPLAEKLAKNAKVNLKLNPDAEVAEALGQFLAHQEQKSETKEHVIDGVDEEPGVSADNELQPGTIDQPRSEVRDGGNSPCPTDSGDSEKTPRWGCLTPETEHSYRFETIEQLIEEDVSVVANNRDINMYYSEKYPDIDELTLDFISEVMNYICSRQVFRAGMAYLNMTELEFVELHSRLRLFTLSRIIGRVYWSKSEYINNFISYKRFILNPIRYYFIKEGIAWSHDLEMSFWNAVGQHNGMIIYNERDGLNNEIVVRMFIDTCVSKGLLNAETNKDVIEHICGVPMMQRELGPSLEG